MSTEDQTTSPETHESDRRNFIRNSALAAGTVAAIGVASDASAYEKEANLSARPQKLTAAFDTKYQTKITREDIFIIVEQMLDIAGCPACGLNGYDFNLTVNPVFEPKVEIPVNIGVQY